MNEPGKRAKAPTSRARDRALWIAGGLWGLWVVLPSVMLSNVRDREALAGRLGARRTLGLAGAIRS